MQLMCDPHCRSVIGFEMLIQKEWVAMGHPFCSRSKLVTAPYNKSDDENDTSQVSNIQNYKYPLVFILELCLRHLYFFCSWIVCGNSLSSFLQHFPSLVFILSNCTHAACPTFMEHLCLIVVVTCMTL